MALLCARLVDESFLRQSAFSPVDRYCPPAKQTAMLGLMMRFFDLARAALDRGVPVPAIAGAGFFRRLSRMGEEIGAEDTAGFEALMRQMEDEITRLEGVSADAF